MDNEHTSVTRQYPMTHLHQKWDEHVDLAGEDYTTWAPTFEAIEEMVLITRSALEAATTDHERATYRAALDLVFYDITPTDHAWLDSR